MKGKKKQFSDNTPYLLTLPLQIPNWILSLFGIRSGNLKLGFGH